MLIAEKCRKAEKRRNVSACFSISALFSAIIFSQIRIQIADFRSLRRKTENNVSLRPYYCNFTTLSDSVHYSSSKMDFAFSFFLSPEVVPLCVPDGVTLCVPDVAPVDVLGVPVEPEEGVMF